jgi:hypothetical protein
MVQNGVQFLRFHFQLYGCALGPPLIIAAITSLAIDKAGASLKPLVASAGATSPSEFASSITFWSVIELFAIMLLLTKKDGLPVSIG